MNFKRAAAKFCFNQAVREGVHKGQWKSVFAQAEALCKGDNIDFLVVFDGDGMLQTAWPARLDERYPEAQFKELPLFQSFKQYVDSESLIDVPVFSSFERWPQQVFKGYGVEIENDTGIALLAAGIIPNDYFDEPLGYALIGIHSDQLSIPFKEFSRITGQISLLVDENNPLVFSGLSGDKADIEKSLHRCWSDHIGDISFHDAAFRFRHADQIYNIHTHELMNFSGPATFVSPEAASLLIVSGENINTFSETSAKIGQVGHRVFKNVFYAALLVTLLVLILAIFVVNIVGAKISKPIRTAADMSDEIAAGNLERLLDESSADETGKLSKSMNKMVRHLQEMQTRNENHLKTIAAGKERTEKILSAIQEGVILIDADTHHILDVNPAAVIMINARRDEIIGDVYDHYIRPDKKRHHPHSRHKTSFGYNEHVLLTRDGKRMPIFRTSVHIILDERQCLLETFLDISPLVKAQEERQRLERQLQQAKKMEAIGTLAGGVAHDLNNVLSGIVSYPDLILMQMPKDDPLYKSISLIKSSGEKAAHIVEDLLTLARRGVAHAAIVNLNQLVEDYLAGLECEQLKSFHPEVEIRFKGDGDLLNIKGSPVHLSKTIMNLVSNAAEAMPDGGQILIATENRYIDVDDVDYDGIKEGDYVVLTVSDTGIGISLADQERIFEPFYTKKVMGRSGTGLGMAVVWGTVKDHEGYIDIQSAEGKGTTFTLYWPATREEAAEKQSELSIDDYKGHGESILVVDDVQEQREIAELIFSKLGYQVDTVASGEQALEYIQKRAVDLVVLDMVMAPGIDGLDTYRQIIKIRPKQKAIIASGFSESGRVKTAQQLGVGHYIKKPYTIEKIASAVWKELKK